MSSCNCACSHCGSQSSPADPCSCLDEISSGVPVVLDENCNQRSLISNGGILTTDNNGVGRISDGSEGEGLITLDPAESPALDSLFGGSGGNLYCIGKDAPEGAIIVKKGGKWVVTFADTVKKTYDGASLKKGVGNIAAFICGAEGTVELGRLQVCPESLIYINADNAPECKTISQLTDDIELELCNTAVAPSTGFVADHFLACENGVIKKVPKVEDLAPTVITHAAMPWYQIGTAGLTLELTQPLFSFTPSLLPGYEAKYKTVWLYARLIASSHGADYRVIINVGNQPVIDGIVREEPNLSGDFINPTLVFPFPIGTGTPIPVVKNVDFNVGGGNTGQTFQMAFWLNLVGWST